MKGRSRTVFIFTSFALILTVIFLLGLYFAKLRNNSYATTGSSAQVMTGDYGSTNNKPKSSNHGSSSPKVSSSPSPAGETPAATGQQAVTPTADQTSNQDSPSKVAATGTSLFDVTVTTLLMTLAAYFTVHLRKTHLIFKKYTRP